MADTNRRKGGHSHNPPPPQQQLQQQFSVYPQPIMHASQQNPYPSPYQQHQPQSYQQHQPQSYQQHQPQHSQAAGVSTNRNPLYRNAGASTSSSNSRPGGVKSAISGAKMGIKSGMTVEELKRLTQKRIQQSTASARLNSSNPATPTATAAAEGFSASRPATPRINVALVQATSTPAAVATPPVVPKTGMSVQELKQLTALRVASQHVPVHASEVTGLVSKAVLHNAAKSHYRETAGRNLLTPEQTAKRSHHTRSNSSTQLGSSQYAGFGTDLIHSHGPLSSGSGEARGHRSRSRSSQLPNADSLDDNMTMRYSYTSGQTPEDYYASYDFGRVDGDNSISSHGSDSGCGSLNDGKASGRNSSLQFSQDSFPPPPPMGECGGFVSTALPSWSPPPARTKKLSSSASSGATFYSQQTSYYNTTSAEEPASTSDNVAGASPVQDQNSMLTPPPGLTRRPSMTVPWQVAEAVLMTPQTSTGRKKLELDSENSSGGLNSSAAEATANLAGFSLQSSTRSRVNIGTHPPPPSSSSLATLSSSPSSSTGTSQPGGATVVARRGSFGNAAEFFKFRRRSKSRLELARDLSFGENGETGGYPCYGAAGSMPGIAERHGDAEDGTHDGSGASSSTSGNDESSSQGYTDEDVVQVTGGYDDTAEISGSFVSFYNASRQHQSGLSSLSIPPPPPPPPVTDDDVGSSTTLLTKGQSGLPLMSPNGARLRKVAELARQGSLSSEDKTRAKDEIIQSSLGIGASNAARLLATKKEDWGDRVSATAPSGTAPPGFPGMLRTTTPKASAKKMLAPGSGTGRSSAAERTGSSSISASAAAAAAALGATMPSASPATSQQAGTASSSFLEERLAAAAQRVADCVGKGDMTGFQRAMDELDWLRNEASKIMRG